nr:hypothetical protein [Candidatus Symbiopectobacterium sp. 'North America']
MTFAPNSLILYVQDVDVSARFYQTLLGAPPLETFPDFTLFALQPEFSLGLQARQGIFPPPQPQVGGIELCMSQATDSDVERFTARGWHRASPSWLNQRVWSSATPLWRRTRMVIGCGCAPQMSRIISRR